MRSIELKFLGSEIHALRTKATATEDEKAEIIAYMNAFGPPIDYKAQIISILVNFPQGMPAMDVRRRGKLSDIVENASGNLLIEEADYALLKSAVEAWPWMSASKNIRAFLDDTLDAKEVALASLSSAA